MSKQSLLRARTLFGGLVVGLVTTVGAGVVGAGTAQASLLPYVPWSSYLPGWTEEYIPSSDNDCVSGHSNCLHGTLKELARIADSTADSCSHDAIFSLAYLRMTQTYRWAREIEGYYSNLKFQNHLDAVFARYYTDAYYAYKAGNRAAVPKAWLYAFDSSKNKKVTANGDLLLGMNAHINRDLPFVLAAVGLVEPDGSSAKADFDAHEEWLLTSTAPLMAEAAVRFDPSMDDTADPLRLGYWTLFQMISGWRETAWRNAERLVTAETPAERAEVAASIESYANSVAQGLVLTQATVTLPLLGGGSAARDSFCAANHDEAGPMAYDFGMASPYGWN